MLTNLAKTDIKLSKKKNKIVVNEFQTKNSLENGFWDSIPKRCKGVHFVDLGESIPTHIYLQNLASIQPRTSPSKLDS